MYIPIGNIGSVHTDILFQSKSLISLYQIKLPLFFLYSEPTP